MDLTRLLHWIFGLFLHFHLWYVILFGRIVKKLKIHKIHYRGSSLFILSVIVVAFLIYVFRGYMKVGI